MRDGTQNTFILSRKYMKTSNFIVGKYRFTFEATEQIKLPAFKGGLFHGALGHGLMKISPYWNEYFTSGQESGLPRAYVLLPPLDNVTSYLPGYQFSCEMTLFGKAAMYWPVCHCALEFAAGNLGLGKTRGKARAVGIESAVPGAAGEKNLPVVTWQDILESRLPSLPSKRLTVKFITRLRLKDQNCLVRRPPVFSTFFSRLLGRLKSLVSFYGGGMECWITREEEQRLQELSKKVKIFSHSLVWDDWSRYSSRQKSWMKFGGLHGSITFEGDLEPFLPFLALGEWTHLGGKTTFGLGKYILEGTRDGEQEISASKMRKP